MIQRSQGSTLTIEGAPKLPAFRLFAFLGQINTAIGFVISRIERKADRRFGSAQALFPTDAQGLWKGQIQFNLPSIAHHCVLYSKFHQGHITFGGSSHICSYTSRDIDMSFVPLNRNDRLTSTIDSLTILARDAGWAVGHLGKGKPKDRGKGKKGKGKGSAGSAAASSGGPMGVGGQ